MSEAELRKRYEEILWHSGLIELSDFGYKVSNKIMFSRGYRYCNGTAILGTNQSGLSHSDPRTRPQDFLDDMIDELLQREDLANLKAFVVGGDPSHFEEIKKALGDRRIPIVGEYLDSWQFGQIFPKNHQGYKDLVVVPSAKEVILCSWPGVLSRYARHQENFSAIFK